MIEVGDRVEVIDGTFGVILSFDRFRQTIVGVKLDDGRIVNRWIGYLRVVKAKPDSTVDGPEVDILKAYHRGFITKETTVAILIAISFMREERYGIVHSKLDRD